MTLSRRGNLIDTGNFPLADSAHADAAASSEAAAYLEYANKYIPQI